MSVRSIRRTKVKNRVCETTENHAWNKRMFFLAWKKIQGLVLCNDGKYHPAKRTSTRLFRA